MEQPQYLVAHLRRALAEDPRTAELGIHVTIRGDTVVLDGEVGTEERKQVLETIVREQLPHAQLHNDVHVARPGAPAPSEALGRASRERS
ncbi:BON domain-containing protein [Nocardia sp. NPDC051321]|uniref:BON domain-containing protein n=1 Tax=Nocardia sp. NPDC051321 TaxID=3364323 RepID=UPI0037886ED6